MLPLFAQQSIDSAGNRPSPYLIDWSRQVVAALSASDVAAEPDPTTQPDYLLASTAITAGAGISVYGSLAGGAVVVGLSQLTDSGAGALLGITRDAYGRVSGTTDATITEVAGETVVTNGDAVAGPPTVGLADTAVTPGAYTNANITVDAKGRITAAADGSGGGGSDIASSGSQTWDFLDGVTLSSATGTSFVTNASTPVAHNSGASATATIIPSESSAAGICQLATGGTSTGYSRMFFNSPRVVCGTDELQGDFRIRIPTLGNGTNRFDVLVGYANSISGAGLQRIQAYYQDDVNSGQWMLSVTDGGGSTVGNSTVAAVANTFTNLRIAINAAGTSVSLYVDDMGTPAVTVAANIPTVALAPSAWITKTVGGTSRTLDVDYCKHTQIFTTPR